MLGPRLWRGCGLDGILDRAGNRNYVMVRESVVRVSISRGGKRRGTNATMDDILEREALPDAMTIARCRELLGDEALELSDEDVDAVRCHAHAMAHLLVEIFLAKPTPSLNR